MSAWEGACGPTTRHEVRVARLPSFYWAEAGRGGAASPTDMLLRSGPGWAAPGSLTVIRGVFVAPRLALTRPPSYNGCGPLLTQSASTVAQMTSPSPSTTECAPPSSCASPG
jgi:hypothetical protein